MAIRRRCLGPPLSRYLIDRYPPSRSAVRAATRRRRDLEKSRHRILRRLTAAFDFQRLRISPVPAARHGGKTPPGRDHFASVLHKGPEAAGEDSGRALAAKMVWSGGYPEALASFIASQARRELPANVGCLYLGDDRPTLWCATDRRES